jgi:hypothetical protein
LLAQLGWGLLAGLGIGILMGAITSAVIWLLMRRDKIKGVQEQVYVSGTVRWLLNKRVYRVADLTSSTTDVLGKTVAILKDPSLGYALRFWFERFFNKILGRELDAERYGKVDRQVEKQIVSMTPATVAGTVLQQEDKHRDEETSRLRSMRVISIVIGVALAYWLQIDAAELLNSAVPDISHQINIPALTVSGAQLHAFWPALSPHRLLTPGIILTGLAASAGSKFWHDLLGRLQVARGKAEEAAQLVRKVQGMVGSGEEE